MPMTQEEFENYCLHHGLKQGARLFLKRVRTNAPARRVGGGTSNVACRFASKKMGVTIQAESQRPELAFVLSLEFDDDVLEFYDQCETLNVKKVDRNGKSALRPYTPDYLVLSRSKGVTLYECKTDEQVETLLKNDPNWWRDGYGGVHFKPLDGWAAEHGLHSRVALASEIPAQRTQNLQMLADYYGDNVPPITATAKRRILALFAEQPWLSRRQIINGDPQIQADDVNWMIAHRELWIDFDRQVLADDIRTMIFKDRNAIEAYGAMERTSVSSDPFRVTAVSLREGSHVLWDGKPYVVANLGETFLYFQDAWSKLHRLSIDDANLLISSGQLMDAAACGEPASLAAEAKLLEASPRDLQEGLARLKTLERGLAGEYVPKRTLARLRSQYRCGEQAYGSGFLGLVTLTSKRGNRNRKLHPQVIEEMAAIAAEMILIPDPKSTAVCLGELELRCKEKCLTPPSEKTFQKLRRSFRQEVIMRAQKGHKAAHPFEPWHVSIAYKTPRHGQRPFEIGHIDHTELGLHFVDEKYGSRSIRAWLTLLIDAYSRKVLAWHLTFEKPSRRSLMMVIRNCLEKHGRGCDYYVVDQGAEFNGIDFETLLARLGAHKKERPASKPRFGNVVERFFGVSEQEFTSQLQANNQFLKNPRGMSPSHDPTKRAVWTLREFKLAWATWVDEYYDRREHGTLGVSPNVAFEEGLRRFGHRSHRRIVFDAALKMLCMPAVGTSDGCLRIDADHGLVKVHGVQYHGAVLRNGALHRHRVPARYDPYDVSRLHVYLYEQWHVLLCAFASELESFSVHELQIHTEELKAKYGATYIRRMTNRMMLASFMRSVKATEEVLEKIRQRAAQAQEENESFTDAVSPSKKKPTTRKAPTRTSNFDVNAHWGITLEKNKEQ